MKKKTSTRQTVLMVILIVLVAVLVIYRQTSQNNSYNRNQIISPSVSLPPAQARWYHSSTLKFSILVPAEYRIEDQLVTVTLHHAQGDIVISRVGTNFDTLEEYLTYLSMKNKIDLRNQQKLSINGLNSIKTKIDYQSSINPSKDVYFIYSKHYVFSLSTTISSLFSDLDTIAQSFQYIP